MRVDDAREANQSGLVACINQRIGRAFLLACSFHIAPTPSPSPVIKGLAKVQKGEEEEENTNNEMNNMKNRPLSQKNKKDWEVRSGP